MIQRHKTYNLEVLSLFSGSVSKHEWVCNIAVGADSIFTFDALLLLAPFKNVGDHESLQTTPLLSLSFGSPKRYREADNPLLSPYTRYVRRKLSLTAHFYDLGGHENRRGDPLLDSSSTGFPKAEEVFHAFHASGKRFVLMGFFT